MSRARAASDPSQTVSSPTAVIQQVTAEAGTAQCSFCGKLRHRVQTMASAGDLRICNECLDLCDEILSDVPPEPPR